MDGGDGQGALLVVGHGDQDDHSNQDGLAPVGGIEELEQVHAQGEADVCSGKDHL